jgi:hypothetical protein
MMTLDSLITAGIIACAAAFLYRKFAKSNKSGGCGCASGGSCCGSHKRAAETHCCGSHK